MNQAAMKRTFLLIIAILLLQIPLREFVTEPYPAILFPAGAYNVRDGEVITSDYALTAITANGQRYVVNTHHLLNSVPEQYRSFVMKRNFGLAPDTGRAAQDIPDVAIRHGRAWLRNRLAALLGKDDYVMLAITQYRTIRTFENIMQPSERRVVRVTEIPLR